MSKIPSLVAGAGGCYRPAPSKPLPEGPIEARPLPGQPPRGGCFPAPTPLPQIPGGGCFPTPNPLPDHGGLRDWVNKQRSASVANTQANQVERIQKGLENGTISQDEAAELLKQQEGIAETIKQAQADGFISASEQAAIRRQQLQASFGIHQARNSFEFENLFRDRGTVQTQAEQLGQIAQGIRSGQLSGGEASGLLGGQAGIAEKAAEARADGQTSISERLDLALEQAKAARDIHQEKTDFEKAPHGRNRYPIFY